MNNPSNGTVESIDDVPHVFYDGYWIRYYQPPEETLSEKKKLIDALTKRTFHHTEAGINTPGKHLTLAREQYSQELDPAKKRVSAAILAGAVFNRASDIFSSVVLLEDKGITIYRDNPLLKECSKLFMEAFELSEQVRHVSGEEGVDELWGEPVKVFTMTIAEYYHSRYRKVAASMQDIDSIGQRIIQQICSYAPFAEAQSLVEDYVYISKKECEIFRGDPDYFKIWPEFVATGEKLYNFEPSAIAGGDITDTLKIQTTKSLLCDGKNLLTWIANVRVPMPKSSGRYFARLDALQDELNNS